MPNVLRLLEFLTVSIAIVATPIVASAIVVRHDVADAVYVRAAQATVFEAVGTLHADRTMLGAGTLICDRWVLTSAHVVANVTAREWQFEVGDARYVVDDIFVNPGWTGDPGDGHDIALLRLARPVRGIQPVPLFRGTDDLGTRVSVVGFGYTGDGLSGVRSFDGSLRAATNVLEEYDADYMLFFFDEPASRYATSREGMAAFNDSGGPVFVPSDKGWLLAGTISFIRDWNENGVLADYGDVQGASRLVLHLPWLDTVLASCAGDLNASGRVEFADLLAVLSAWGPCGGCAEDVDASGQVDLHDLVTLLTAWGPCP